MHLDGDTADDKRRSSDCSASVRPDEREYGPDDDFVVLVDPDGYRFCVVDAAEEA